MGGDAILTGGDPDAVWTDIRDGKSPLNWLMLGYNGKDPGSMFVHKKSVLGLESFVENLDDDKVLFCGLRCRAIDDRGRVQSVRNKFIFVAWVGSDVKPMARAKVSAHKSPFEAFFSGTHISVQTQDRTDLDPKVLEDRLQSSTGAHKPTGYDFSGGLRGGNIEEEIAEAKRQSEQPVQRPSSAQRDRPGSAQRRPRSAERPPSAGAQRAPTRSAPAPTPTPAPAAVQQAPAPTQAPVDLPLGPVDSGGDPDAVWKEIRDGKSPLSWMMLGYNGKDAASMFIHKKSATGLHAFVHHLDDDKVLFCGLRCRAIDDRGRVQSVRNKFIFVAWVGSDVKPMARAKVSAHKSPFEAFFSGTHISVQTQDRTDLDPKVLEDRLQSSTGAHKPTGYDFSGGLSAADAEAAAKAELENAGKAEAKGDTAAGKQDTSESDAAEAEGRRKAEEAAAAATAEAAKVEAAKAEEAAKLEASAKEAELKAAEEAAAAAEAEAKAKEAAEKEEQAAKLAAEAEAQAQAEAEQKAAEEAAAAAEAAKAELDKANATAEAEEAAKLAAEAEASAKEAELKAAEEAAAAAKAAEAEAKAKEAAEKEEEAAKLAAEAEAQAQAEAEQKAAEEAASAAKAAEAEAKAKEAAEKEEEAAKLAAEAEQKAAEEDASAAKAAEAAAAETEKAAEEAAKAESAKAEEAAKLAAEAEASAKEAELKAAEEAAAAAKAAEAEAKAKEAAEKEEQAAKLVAEAEAQAQAEAEEKAAEEAASAAKAAEEAAKAEATKAEEAAKLAAEAEARAKEAELKAADAADAEPQGAPAKAAPPAADTPTPDAPRQPDAEAAPPPPEAAPQQTPPDTTADTPETAPPAAAPPAPQPPQADDEGLEVALQEGYQLPGLVLLCEVHEEMKTEERAAEGAAPVSVPGSRPSSAATPASAHLSASSTPQDAHSLRRLRSAAERDQLLGLLTVIELDTSRSPPVSRPGSAAIRALKPVPHEAVASALQQLEEAAPPLPPVPPIVLQAGEALEVACEVAALPALLHLQEAIGGGGGAVPAVESGDEPARGVPGVAAAPEGVVLCDGDVLACLIECDPSAEALLLVASLFQKESSVAAADADRSKAEKGPQVEEEKEGPQQQQQQQQAEAQEAAPQAEEVQTSQPSLDQAPEAPSGQETQQQHQTPGAQEQRPSQPAVAEAEPRAALAEQVAERDMEMDLLLAELRKERERAQALEKRATDAEQGKRQVEVWAREEKQRRQHLETSTNEQAERVAQLELAMQQKDDVIQQDKVSLDARLQELQRAKDEYRSLELRQDELVSQRLEKEKEAQQAVTQLREVQRTDHESLAAAHAEDLLAVTTNETQGRVELSVDEVDLRRKLQKRIDRYNVSCLREAMRAAAPNTPLEPQHEAGSQTPRTPLRYDGTLTTYITVDASYTAYDLMLKWGDTYETVREAINEHPVLKGLGDDRYSFSADPTFDEAQRVQYPFVPLNINNGDYESKLSSDYGRPIQCFTLGNDDQWEQRRLASAQRKKKAVTAQPFPPYGLTVPIIMLHLRDMSDRLDLWSGRGRCPFNFMPFVSDYLGNTSLHYSAAEGDAVALQKLMDHGCTPQHVNSRGQTALHVAAHAGHHRLLAALVKDFEKVLNLKDTQGRTALHCATIAKRLLCVDTLLRQGCDVNATDNHTLTPLHYSIAANSTSCASKLLRAGARVALDASAVSLCQRAVQGRRSSTGILSYSALPVIQCMAGLSDTSAAAMFTSTTSHFAPSRRDSGGGSILPVAGVSGLDPAAPFAALRDVIGKASVTPNVQCLERGAASGRRVGTRTALISAVHQNKKEFLRQMVDFLKVTEARRQVVTHSKADGWVGVDIADDSHLACMACLSGDVELVDIVASALDSETLRITAPGMLRCALIAPNPQHVTAYILKEHFKYAPRLSSCFVPLHVALPTSVYAQRGAHRPHHACSSATRVSPLGCTLLAGQSHVAGSLFISRAREANDACLQLAPVSNTGDCFSVTPLWLSVYSGDHEAVATLLQKGASSLKGVVHSEEPFDTPSVQGQLATHGRSDAVSSCFGAAFDLFSYTITDSAQGRVGRRAVVRRPQPPVFGRAPPAELASRRLRCLELLFEDLAHQQQTSRKSLPLDTVAAGLAFTTDRATQAVDVTKTTPSSLLVCVIRLLQAAGAPAEQVKSTLTSACSFVPVGEDLMRRGVAHHTVADVACTLFEHGLLVARYDRLLHVEQKRFEATSTLPADVQQKLPLLPRPASASLGLSAKETPFIAFSRFISIAGMHTAAELQYLVLQRLVQWHCKRGVHHAVKGLLLSAWSRLAGSGAAADANLFVEHVVGLLPCVMRQADLLGTAEVASAVLTLPLATQQAVAGHRAFLVALATFPSKIIPGAAKALLRTLHGTPDSAAAEGLSSLINNVVWRGMRETMLTIAASAGSSGAVKFLLDAYPSLYTEVNEAGHTPLHVACARGHIPVLLKLLDADPVALTIKDESLSSSLGHPASFAILPAKRRKHLTSVAHSALESAASEWKTQAEVVGLTPLQYMTRMMQVKLRMQLEQLAAPSLPLPMSPPAKKGGAARSRGLVRMAEDAVLLFARPLCEALFMHPLEAVGEPLLPFVVGSSALDPHRMQPRELSTEQLQQIARERLVAAQHGAAKKLEKYPELITDEPISDIASLYVQRVAKPNKALLKQLDEEGMLIADLDLSANYVGPKTITFVLEEVLPRLPHLERLSFRSCQITNADVSLLCEAAARHPSLRAVDLSGNPDVYLDGAMKLRRLRQRNPRVRVELAHTGVSASMVQEIDCIDDING